MAKWTREFQLWIHQLLFGDEYQIHGLPVIAPASINSDIRYLLLKNRPYEQAEVKFCREELNFGDNVLELGGSIGVVSAVIRSRIGPDALHVIVEADDTLADVCLENARKGANPNRVFIVNAAIDYSGSTFVNFQVGQNSHTGRLSQSASGKKIRAIRAIDCIAPFADEHFSLVCDIEGAELNLVRYDGPVFDRCKRIIMELHPAIYPRGEDDKRFIMAAIGNLGFRNVGQAGDVYFWER